jgi:NAD(P)-dependent dehydrogenase (short-subunit alcohol dehydrogenase family)
MDLNEMTTVVTGASRGFGRGIATALVEAGGNVVGLARTAEPLRELGDDLGPAFTGVVGDAADPQLATRLLTEHVPQVLVLNAGAMPTMLPLQAHTWTSFSRNWESDTRQGFEWCRAALLVPLAPGSLVVTVSSGAALRGSPRSGGYAAAKSALRFISSYAAEQSVQSGLGIRFVTLLPQLSPATELGATGVAAYAEAQGVSPDVFAKNLEPILTPEIMGQLMVEVILESTDTTHRELLVTGAGLRAVAA